MAELSPEAKRLLAELRGVDDPTTAERASGEAAVRRMLEAHGMELPQPPLFSKQTGTAAAARSGAAVKVASLFGAALFATLGWLSINAWPSSHTTTGSAKVEAASPPPPVRSGQATAADEAHSELVAEPVAQPQPSGRAAPAHASARRTQPQSAEGSLAAELRFLSTVDAEIRAGAHERALRMLQQHKPSTAVLQEERAAMRVLALCGRDLDDHAVRERDRFLTSHPSSVLSARVRSACTGAPSR
jgi:hypothetical protein